MRFLHSCGAFGWTFGHPLYVFVSQSAFVSAKNKFPARKNHGDAINLHRMSLSIIMLCTVLCV